MSFRVGKWIEHNGYNIEVTSNSTGICLTSYLPYFWCTYSGYEWEEMLDNFTAKLEELENV